MFTDETLRELRLHLHSLCVGPDSLYFNGHTNIGSGRFVTFGVKSLLEAGQNLRDAMLFNIFSYMNNELLRAGNTVAAIDELYLYLNNKTAIGYIRACMKRARKKELSLIHICPSRGQMEALRMAWIRLCLKWTGTETTIFSCGTGAGIC